MDFKLIGNPCAKHGPYTFYKAFKYSKHGTSNILAISEFFFVKVWSDSDFVSIGELRLLWHDKNSEQTLASLRLYVLPESTPAGRRDIHGEHEVLVMSDKVVLRLEDLLTWITEPQHWSWGLAAVYESSAKPMDRPTLLGDNTAMDLEDVDKEKDLLGESHWETRNGVVVMSFPRYCRYRGVLKRLEGLPDQWLRSALVAALGGFTVPGRNTRVLFCRDTFEYPELEGHELLCNHLAPKIRGRPRKKRKVDLSPDSSDSDSESSSISTSSSSTNKTKYSSPHKSLVPFSKSAAVSITGLRRVGRLPGTSLLNEQKEFHARLFAFMKARQTPINRVPTIGFRSLDLYKLYNKVCLLGGFDAVSTNRLWKHIYDEMGGDMSSTSAATLCRRHYERLLLPYERHVAPNRGKNSLTKLKRNNEISVTTKSATINPHDKWHSSHYKGMLYKGAVGDGKKDSNKHSGPLEVINLSSDESPVKGRDQEVVNLVSDSEDSFSPIKMKPLHTNLSPRKQKLEILKEGGLEVTAISTLSRSPTLSPIAGKVANGRSSFDKPQPVVIQQPKLPQLIREGKPKVSITVTPDVSHMMPVSRHPATAWSAGGVVYGNPKEGVGGVWPSGGEVLDLRTRGPVGSNLEISLVPARDTAHPPPRNHSRPPNIVPSVSLSVHGDKRRSKAHVAGAVEGRGVGVGVTAGSGFPMVDPMYLSALYSGLFTPFTPTTPHQLQLYKELIHRQNIPDSFPRLLQDGSTSISLVDRAPGQTPE